MRRGDDDAVRVAAGQLAGGRRAVVVEPQDGVRHGGGGRDVVAAVDQDLHVVGDQDFHRRPPRRLGQRVGVPADQQRTGGALRGAILTDRLGDREDVRLVERPVEAGATVPGGAERDALVRVGEVRAPVGVRLHHGVEVDEVVGAGGLTGAGVHACDPTPRTGPGATHAVTGRCHQDRGLQTDPGNHQRPRPMSEPSPGSGGRI